MYHHYKGATRSIKYARYEIRQADRLLRNRYLTAADIDCLSEAYARITIARQQIEEEIIVARRQLTITEKGKP